MITLHPGEEILLERRQYWLPIAIEGITLFIFGVAPLFAFFAVEAVPSSLQDFIRGYTLPFLFLAVLWLLVIWIIFAITWTNYYLDVLLITNKRVVDIQQLGLFARDLAELRLENIEDLRVEIIGFLPSLLRFGNIHIQTAGEHREFVVRNIRDPHGIRDLISRCHDEAMERKPVASG